jgi:hypothetical protein
MLPSHSDKYVRRLSLRRRLDEVQLWSLLKWCGYVLLAVLLARGRYVLVLDPRQGTE